MAEHSFTSLERDGWSRNAAAYDDVILGWTSQAFAPLLDTFGALRGQRLLDVASGTGHLAKAAAERGAMAEGVDISPEMAARAGSAFPALAFRVGNADALPYDDRSFDAVTCCFGLLHMERPEQAVAEAFRVLRPGGRFSYTVWHGPATGGTLVGILLKTFQRLGNMEVGLPPAPPMFQFAEAETRDRVLAGAGFTAIAGRDLDLRWRAAKPEDIGRLLKEGMVRTRLIFERQTPAVQESILAAVIDEARAFATPAGVEIPNVAHLATAVKPKS
jgi:ubiquinone/menaquinone biosynthesis C-methylase UbiE